MASPRASKRPSTLQAIRAYFQPSIVHITLLGIASGLPFSLILGTLTFWLSEFSIEKSTIGLFAFATTPYTLKFLWSPIVESVAIPGLTSRLGQRRSWIIASQLCLMVSIILLGALNPTTQIEWMALAAILVAFFSATQDIAIDAYRIESLPQEEQAVGAAASVFGWRVGALLSGAGTLYFVAFFESSHGVDYSWLFGYSATALVLVPIMLYMLKAPEPAGAEKAESHDYTQWLHNNVAKPFKQFMTRSRWPLILIFIVIFKLGDAMALSMLSPFIVDLGYSKIENANISKLFGFWATIGGALLGGMVALRLGIIRGLLLTGILQMLSTLSFIWLAHMGHNMTVFAVTIALENIASGMGTSVFVAYISRLCHKDFTATQYALFSACAAQGRTVFAGSAGYLSEVLGWDMFFLLCSLIALPGIILLKWLPRP